MILPSRLSEDPEARERFDREARTISSAWSVAALLGVAAVLSTFVFRARGHL
jgi:hypothetical protein